MKKGRILLLLLCVCLTACTGQQGTVSWGQVTGTEMPETAEANVCESETETPEMIYVDVTGAVKHPGVVKVPYGARVYEAIAKAGGMTEDAASEYINQASVLTDGQQIKIYTLEETLERDVQPEGGSAQGTEKCEEDSDTQGKININEATAEELMELPGIGEAKAADIIRYREENGDFQTIEEIMNISGIKEAVFEKIRDKIVVTQ